MLLVLHCQNVKFAADSAISVGYRKLQSRWNRYWKVQKTVFKIPTCQI